jgi:hypothetical protein
MSEDQTRYGSALTTDRARLRELCVASELDWYGLDSTWTGERTLGSLSTGADSVVEYGVLIHGDPPSKRPDEASPRRFATVVTMARLGRRAIGGADHPVGHIEATTEAAVADDWPWRLDRALRQEWLHQQTELAYELAEHLDAEPWRALALPLNGSPAKFHYHESEYGWVLAGETPTCYLGAYGRGVSAYGLGFTVLTDLTAYADPA